MSETPPLIPSLCLVISCMQFCHMSQFLYILVTSSSTNSRWSMSFLLYDDVQCLHFSGLHDDKRISWWDYISRWRMSPVLNYIMVSVSVIICHDELCALDMSAYPAVTWLKCCRYGVKLYPINQSINHVCVSDISMNYFFQCSIQIIC